VQLVAHDVLECGAADSNADAHTQGAHEGVHGGGASAVLGFADGLDGDVDAGKNHAVADTKDTHYRRPDRDWRVEVEEEKESATDGRDSPTAPHGPTEAPEFRGEKGDDNASW
jgi:hypothetical protein